MPTLFCLKKTGPGLVILMSRININRIGDNIMVPTRLNKKSINRFIYFVYIIFTPFKNH